MDSAFEQSAKRAAVEAIERRYEHNQRVRKRAKVGRRLRTFVSVVFGLLVLAGIVRFLTNGWSGGFSLPKFDLNAVRSTLPKFGGMPATQSGSCDSEHRAQYAEVAALFGRGELASWQDAPRESKPSSCAPGTTFHFMVPDGHSFRLFELKAAFAAGGSAHASRAQHAIVELTPFGKPIPSSMADLKTACRPAGCLIASQGRVFVSGGDRSRLEALRKALRARIW